MIHWFSPGWLKKADRFSKGVKKFIAYQRDLMPEDKLAAVQEARKEYDAAMKAKDRAAIEGDNGLEKKLLHLCEKAVPNYNSSPLKENVEVIIVAIIVALGIRAYYLQPFKIPTSSMQPTLNGIIATRMDESQDKPNIIAQAWQYAWNGRNYVNVVVPEEWGETELTGYRQYSKVNFFTFTELQFANNKTLWAYCPAKQLLGELDPQRPWETIGIWRKPTYKHLPIASDDTPQPKLLPERQKVKGGEILARGFVESGDQLLVDKVSYHFLKPKRDDVFVFSTRNIPSMPAQSQHYIKRLTALPGDTLRIEPPLLYINGEKAKGYGVERVMAAEHGYRGYSLNQGAGWLRHIDTEHSQEATLPDQTYMAMGDNSYNSSDSRYWGPVPEKNLVGPALFVYWPFANHFGIIR